jgi:hypothetical protein
MRHADQGPPGRRLKLKLPDYVSRYIDHTGKPRHYFRRKGFPRATLPGLPWSSEFMEAYSNALAMAGLPQPTALMPSTLPGGVVAKRGVDPNIVQPLIGVYLLMRKGIIVYVGSSLNMPKRVADHRGNGRPFDQVFYIATKANQREALERTLIRAVNPLQNKAHRSVVVAVQKEMGVDQQRQ